MVQAIWNVHDTAQLVDRQLLLNWARQLEQEACQWRRSFGYGGRTTCRYCESGYPSNHWKSRLRIWNNGYAGRQWVQVVIDDTPMSDRIKMRPGCHAAINEQLLKAYSQLVEPQT